MNDPRPRTAPEFAIEPHERSLARRVFLARVENGATVEAAKHQAVHAVKVWRQLDLFDGPIGVGEEEPLPGEPSSWMRFAREADAALAAEHGLGRPKIAELYARYRDEFDFMASLVALAPERSNNGSDVPPAGEDPLEKTTLNGAPVDLDSGVPLGNGSKLVTAMTRESDVLDDFLGIPRQN